MARGVKVELECTQCSDYSVLRKWESKWRWNSAFALFAEWSVSFNRVTGWKRPVNYGISWNLRGLCRFSVMGD